MQPYFNIQRKSKELKLSFLKGMICVWHYGKSDTSLISEDLQTMIWTLKDKSKHQAKGRTFEMCWVEITKENKEGEERGSNLIRFKPQGGAMEQEKIRLEGEVHLFIYYFKRFI